MPLPVVLAWAVAAVLSLALIWWAWIAPIPEGMWETKTREARGNVAIPLVVLLVLAAVALPRFFL